MALILKLPDSTIQLIAAGEIITRPVNIVKELLENSLDAGSTNVRVTIEQGGLRLIEIIDNGSGICRSNAEMLCRRYTTSKLCTADDLTRISTFGFRGEALASISEMADLEVRTFCMQSDKMGWIGKYKRGELVEPPQDKYLQNVGTHLRITNLFSAVPSRRFALESTVSAERKTIEDMIIRYAIHHRDEVTISLKDGNNDLVCLLAPMQIGPCLGMFFGFEMENNLIELNISSDNNLKFDAQLHLSYKKLSGSGSVNFTFILFVNDRLVECNDLKKELEVLIHQYLSMKMYHLLVILSIRIPPYDVDVNTHPSKLTVTLHNHDEIVQLILDRLRLELVQRLNVSKIEPSNPTFQIQKTLTELLSQSVKPKIQEDHAPNCSPEVSELDQNHNSKIVNFKRLNLLAPASLTPAKRSFDLVHNDHSQKTLHQLGGQRKRYSEDIARPWQGVEFMNTPDKVNKDKFNKDISCKSFEVTIMSPSPSAETVLYKLEDEENPEVLPPSRPRRELKLRSIYKLRKLVASEKEKAAVESSQIIKNSTFVGLFDHDRALIQHETKLFAINLKAYLKEQYYQFYLFDFGNFPPIEILPPGNKIKFMVQTTLDDLMKHDKKYYNSLTYKTTNDIVEKLLRHASMFEDYFSLKISRNEILTIPCVMPDIVPNLTFLGKFLIDLANIDYSEEKKCLRNIGRLIANFYSEPPANLKNKAVHRIYHNLIQTKLYEAIKSYLLIPDWLLRKENICQISDTKDLYKVFERC